MSNVKRGEVWLCDLGEDNKRGCEQKSLRPILIVSNNIGHIYSTICMGAIVTSRHKHKLPTHWIIPDYVNLHEESQALMEHIVCVDVIRLTKLLGQINVRDMSIVNRKLKIALGLEGDK